MKEDDFNKFWLSYPNKKAKGAAIKAWDKAKKDFDGDFLKTCLLAIDAQKREKKRLHEAKLFCPEWPMPATWLNQGRWADEVTSNQEVEEKKLEAFCKCGQKAKHASGHCDECLSRKLGEENGSEERLREVFRKLPKKRKDETWSEWGKRLQRGCITGKTYGTTSNNTCPK